MHMEHAKAVLDACYLHEGQHVLMASGRAAKVSEVGPVAIRFDHLERSRPDDYIIIPRHKVHELVRI